MRSPQLVICLLMSLQFMQTGSGSNLKESPNKQNHCGSKWLNLLGQCSDLQVLLGLTLIYTCLDMKQDNGAKTWRLAELAVCHPSWGTGARNIGFIIQQSIFVVGWCWYSKKLPLYRWNYSVDRILNSKWEFYHWNVAPFSQLSF